MSADPSPVVVQDSAVPVPMREGAQELRLRLDFLTWRQVEDEILIFNSGNGSYLMLNRSGRDLWQRLLEGSTEARLVSGLCAEYDISMDLAENDVASFLATLRERQLLIES